MTPAELNKHELKRALELLRAVTTARDRAEAERDEALGLAAAALRLNKRLAGDLNATRDELKFWKDSTDDLHDEIARLRDCNTNLTRDLNAALAKCAELEHHLSPAPNGATREPSEGERGKSQAPHNAEAGEETL